MKLQEQFDVAQPVATVWTFFEQLDRVAECVPGVEQVTGVSSDGIDVRITQSVGPMTATFAAKATIVEKVPEKLITFTVTGKSVRGAMGNVRATVTVQLMPAAEQTTVMVEGDVALAGALGSIGQKVVAKQARKVTVEFSGNLEAALRGQPGARATTVPAAAGTASATPPSAGPRETPAAGYPSTGDMWSKVAAALSAVSVLLGVLSLVQSCSRRGSRR